MKAREYADHSADLFQFFDEQLVFFSDVAVFTGRYKMLQASTGELKFGGEIEFCFNGGLMCFVRLLKRNRRGL